VTSPDVQAEPDAPRPRRSRPRPRNYLAPAERHRLFWKFMPPALVVVLVIGWVERTWFRRPEPAVAPQVDTVLRDQFAHGTTPDAVLIEAEPEPLVADPEDVGASLSALEKVRDDTVFREGDREAWFQIWLGLRSDAQKTLARAPAQPTSFSELFGQPRSFRGRLVRIRGTLHRLQHVQAPPNDYNFDGYWQGWLEPAGGPSSPIVVYFLQVPPDMPTGMSIDERVEVAGYFFKRWAYAAQDAVRTAPLVMAFEPIWKPKTDVRPLVDSVGTIALVTMAALVLLTLLGVRLASRGPAAAKPPPPTDLTESLADVELFSPDEALRKLSAEEKQQS
jgi:hypothetical protein